MIDVRNPEPPRIPRPAVWRFPGKLAVCVAYFNPVGYQTRIENFRRFAEAAVSQGADIHVVSSGPAPEVDGVTNYMDLGPCETLWQKERALNVLIEQLPAEYDKVAWVDADLLFDNPHWVEDTCRQLEHTPVCQCFAWATWLNQAGVPDYWWATSSRMLYRPSAPVACKGGTRFEFRIGHPGFAWAARRETIDAIGGLYDRHVLGSGDSIMTLAFMQDIESHPYFERFSGPFRRACKEWCKRASPIVSRRVGYVPGVIRHLWHGAREDRHYDDRLIRLALANYLPERDIMAGPNGLWKWSPECPKQIRTMVEDYFHARYEDGRPAEGSAGTLGLSLFDTSTSDADL